MTPLEHLLIRDACRALMTDYCIHLDARDEDRFVALFTADAAYVNRTTPSAGADGRDAIRATIQRRPASILSRHVMLNHVITVHNSDTAEGSAVGLVIRGTRDRDSWPMPIRGVELVMEYRMRFRREPEGWRIARNETQRIMDVDAAKEQP